MYKIGSYIPTSEKGANNGVAELDASGKLLSSQVSLASTTISTDVIFTDSRATKKGLEYAADYSASFTARSLVDKAYVDANSGGSGNTIYTANDSLTGDRIVDLLNYTLTLDGTGNNSTHLQVNGKEVYTADPVYVKFNLNGGLTCRGSNSNDGGLNIINGYPGATNKIFQVDRFGGGYWYGNSIALRQSSTGSGISLASGNSLQIYDVNNNLRHDIGVSTGSGNQHCKFYVNGYTNNGDFIIGSSSAISNEKISLQGHTLIKGADTLSASSSLQIYDGDSTPNLLWDFRNNGDIIQGKDSTINLGTSNDLIFENSGTSTNFKLNNASNGYVLNNRSGGIKIRPSLAGNQPLVISNTSDNFDTFTIKANGGGEWSAYNGVKIGELTTNDYAKFTIYDLEFYKGNTIKHKIGFGENGSDVDFWLGGVSSTNSFRVGGNTLINSEAISLKGHTVIQGADTLSTSSALQIYDGNGTPSVLWDFRNNGDLLKGNTVLKIGNNNSITGTITSYVIGSNNNISGGVFGKLAIGDNNAVNGSNAYTIGRYNSISANNVFQFGNFLQSTSQGAFVIGHGVYTDSAQKLVNSTANSLALGWNRTTPQHLISDNGVTFGGADTLSTSTALKLVDGDSTPAVLWDFRNNGDLLKGDTILKVGNSNVITGSGTHRFIFGTGNDINGTSKIWQFCVGVDNELSGSNHGAFGRLNTTTGLGTQYAFGSKNTLNGSYTFSFGGDNVTSANFTNTFGMATSATAIGASVIGYGDSTNFANKLVNNTTNSLALGWNTTTPTYLFASTGATVKVPLDMDNNRITNALVNPSVQEAANSATFTINSDEQTDGVLTAMSANTTIAAPTGTPVQSQSLVFRFKDDGSARTLTWNAIFRAIGITLPTTTTASKLLYVGCKYNSTDTKWDVVSVQEEA